MTSVRLPQPTGGFVWTQAAWGPALQCLPLAQVTAHLFTTRVLRLARSGDGAGWKALAGAFRVTPAAVARLAQVHGTGVVVVRRGNPRPPERVPADILVSDDPDLVLAVQTADCVPLLMVDRRTGAVAAAHAGWRGTAAGVVGQAVRAMGAAFGTVQGDLVAAIGPSIGPCCYEVGNEVRRAFMSAGAAADAWFVAGPNGRSHLDLWRATSDQLLTAGVPAAGIHVAGLCTAHHPGLFCSYRAEGRRAGRLAGVIRAEAR